MLNWQEGLAHQVSGGGRGEGWVPGACSPGEF